MNPLSKQVDTILDDKIRRIARTEYAKANTLPNGQTRKRFVPYRLPAIVTTLIAMRSECANPETTSERLEGIASFATTGEARHLAFAPSA